MPRPPKDFVLNALAHEAGKLDFPPMRPGEGRAGKLRNAFELPQGTFAVILNIAKNRLTLGFFNTEEKAARFSDCVSMHFFPWKRGAKGHADYSLADFNHSLDQVRDDYDLPDVHHFLSRVEGYLISKGVIPKRDDIAKKPALAGKPKSVRDLLCEVMARLDRIERRAPIAVKEIPAPFRHNEIPASPSPEIDTLFA